MATGALLFVLGVWVVLRTVRGDVKLPDLILGGGDGSTTAASVLADSLTTPGGFPVMVAGKHQKTSEYIERHRKEWEAQGIDVDKLIKDAKP